jgi:hypothetical protein
MFALPMSKRGHMKTTVPAKCHPHAKGIFALMAKHGVTYDELEWRSGVLKTTIKAWRKQNYPGLNSLAACYGAFGYQYLPVPPISELPAHIREKVEALAVEMGSQDAVLAALMAGMAEIGPSRPGPSIYSIRDRARRARQAARHQSQPEENRVAA